VPETHYFQGFHKYLEQNIYAAGAFLQENQTRPFAETG
jgi:hypothetical protein